MNRISAIFLLAFITIQAYAQSVVRGTVRDAEGPVAGAFVLGYSGASQKAFSYSDSTGRFSLSSRDGSAIDRVSVSMMGYKTAYASVGEQVSGMEIILEPKQMELRSSLVKGDVVEEKSDTLIYYTEAFKDGTERVAGDLLSKLPGITVSSSGGIRYNGTAINKFYVEGLDLMGNRYGVVSNNLSADDIARIEVYRNHQPVSVLRDVALTDRAAVNIILKEDVKGSWLFSGDAVIGAPDFPQFSVRTMFSRFGKSNQDLYLLKGNNIGEDILREIREQAYFGKSGVFLVSDNDMDSDFRSVLNPRRRVLSISQDYWYDNISGIGSFNHLSKVGPTTQVRLSVQVAAERYCEESFTGEEIHFSDGSRLSLEDEDRYTENRYFISAAASVEDNAPNRFLSDEFSFSGQIRSARSSVSGPVTAGQKYDLPSMKLSNSFKMTRRVGDKGTIEITDNSLFMSGDHSGKYTLMVYEEEILQKYGTREFKNDFSAAMAMPGRWLTPSITAGLLLDYTGVDASLNIPSDGPLSNRLSLDATMLRPYLTYSSRFYVGPLQTRVSIPSSVSVIMLSGGKSVAYPLFSPSISLSCNISQSLEANAGVSYSMSRSDLRSLLDGGVMTSYRTLTYADSLRRQNSFQGRVSLNYSDNPALFYVNVSGSILRTFSDKSVSSVYSDILTTTAYLPLQHGNTTFSASVSAKKYFGVKTFVIEAKGTYQDTSSDMFLQGVKGTYRTRSVEPGLSMSFNPRDWFSMGLSSAYHIASVNGGGESFSRSFSLEGNLRVVPLKRLAFDLVGSYLREEIKDTTISNDPLMRATLSWTFLKATAFLECRNLLDVREYRREYVSTYTSVSSVTMLRPRTFLIGIRMSL
ncbi:MAG: TonB-dependent receptor [Bacteroidales bacterium]|nr:TonB-dependent receptor [Bacteroidales bacterium]